MERTPCGRARARRAGFSPDAGRRGRVEKTRAAALRCAAPAAAHCTGSGKSGRQAFRRPWRAPARRRRSRRESAHSISFRLREGRLRACQRRRWRACPSARRARAGWAAAGSAPRSPADGARPLRSARAIAGFPCARRAAGSGRSATASAQPPMLASIMTMACCRSAHLASRSKGWRSSMRGMMAWV